MGLELGLELGMEVVGVLGVLELGVVEVLEALELGVVEVLELVEEGFVEEVGVLVVVEEVVKPSSVLLFGLYGDDDGVCELYGLGHQ